jgi:matrix metalloproteinase-12 (macrophage elastase)
MGILSALATLLEKANQSPDKAKALIDYLSYFGYIASDKEVSMSELLIAIRRFQEQFGISESDIGAKTVRAMEWPRCAVKEQMVEAAAQAARWGTKDITYYLRRRDSDLAPEVWDACMKKGFDVWSVVTPLKFYKVDKESQANFVVDIGSGRADDFDGPSGTLAWFQLVPSYNFKGQIIGKFDVGETWLKDANGNGRGIILPNVAAHEFGHGLGLTHSSRSSALMAPYYSPNVGTPQSIDDIPRIQNLYGKPVVVPTPTPTPTPVPVPTPNGNLVIEVKGKIDSITIPGYRVTKMS